MASKNQDELKRKIKAGKYPRDKAGIRKVNEMLTPKQKLKLKKTPRYKNQPRNRQR